MADTSVPLTAEELNTLVSTCPEDAWPHAVMQVGRLWCVDTLPVPLQTAAALFRDSGLRWLSVHGEWKANAVTIQYGPYVGGDWKVNDKHFGKTDLLEAVSVAIKYKMLNAEACRSAGSQQ